MGELIGRAVPTNFDQSTAALQQKIFGDTPTPAASPKAEAAEAVDRIRQELSTNPDGVASLRQALSAAAFAGASGRTPEEAAAKLEDTARAYAELALIDLATDQAQGKKSNQYKVFAETNMALTLDGQNASMAAQSTHVAPENQQGAGWVTQLTMRNLNPAIAGVADYVQEQLPPNLHLIRPMAPAPQKPR